MSSSGNGSGAVIFSRPPSTERVTPRARQQLPFAEIEDLCRLAGRLDNFPDEKLSMYAGW